MKFKTSASLMIAVVLGLVTAYVGLDVLKKNKGGSGPGLKVVVAARDMEPGYVIEESDLKLEPVSATFAPAKSLKETKLVVGRTVMATVVKGYPILDNQLSAPGAGSGMQAMIPKGMRAFAVEASEGSAAAGLITPGSFVDVIATLRKGDQPISMAVVQKAKVQFVSRSKAMRSSSSSANASPGSPDSLGPIKSVTLLVTPKQANSLELAQNQGKLKLVLRGNADDGDVEDSSITQNEMLGIKEEPKAEPVAEKPTADAFADPVQPPVDNRRAVQMIKGGSETTIYFDKEGNQQSSEEEGNGAAPTGARAQKSAAKQPPTSTKRPAQQPPQQQTPPNGGDSEAGVPQTASGASPDNQSPRSDVGSGTLR